MNTRRDTLILQLIKYLVDNNPQMPQATDTFDIQSGASQEVASYTDNSKYLNGIQQSFDKKLQHINYTIEELRKEMSQMSLKPSPTNSSASQKLNGHSTDTDLYPLLVEETLQQAEYRLQQLLAGSFLSYANFKDFFLWSGTVQNKVCVVFIQSATKDISNKALAIIGTQVLQELPENIQKADELMRFLNRKLFEFHNRHTSLAQKLKAGVYIIDKKKAKVFFSGAHTHLFSVGSQESKAFKGLEAFAGIPANQYQNTVIDIQRGHTLYLYGGEPPATIHQLWQEITALPIPEKKERLDKWLQQNQTHQAVLGLTF